MLAHKKLWEATIYSAHIPQCTCIFTDCAVTSNTEFTLMQDGIGSLRETEDDAGMYCLFFALYFASEALIIAGKSLPWDDFNEAYIEV